MDTDVALVGHCVQSEVRGDRSRVRTEQMSRYPAPTLPVQNNDLPGDEHIKLTANPAQRKAGRVLGRMSAILAASP